MEPLLIKLFDNVNLNMNVLFCTPDERPPFFKGLISIVEKGWPHKRGFTVLWINFVNYSYKR